MTALLVLVDAYPLVLMHAYPSAYAYRFDYVRLCCHLIMPTCLCLWLLMVAYDIYARLCMFVYLLMVYGISKGKNLLELHSMEEREVVSRNFGIEVR
jgi:hypothetical protein